MGADEAELLIEKRLEKSYSDLLEKVIRENKAFLRKMQDIAEGKIQPPQYYIDTNQVEKWKMGFLQQELRKQQIIQRIGAELDKTGERAAKGIKDGLSSVYFGQYEDTRKEIMSQAGAFSIRESFGMIDRRAAKTAVDDYQKNAPFSKIAYRNLGKNDQIRQRLQSEMSQAIIHGESQRDVIKRIRNVVGSASYNAKRTAQTEGTRIRSQARADTEHEAAQHGVRIVNEWYCRMIPKTKNISGSRDSHKYLNKRMRYEGEPFEIPASESADGEADSLLYPGDPAGRACNVINCGCVLIPHVLLDDEELVDDKIVKKQADPVQEMLEDMQEQIEETDPVIEETTEEPERIMMSKENYPAYLQKGKEGTYSQNLADYINGCEGADPKVVELYSRMGEIGTEVNPKVAHTTKSKIGCASSLDFSTGQYEITEMKLDIPRMDGEYPDGKAGVILHEQMHWIDLLLGTNGNEARLMSSQNTELYNAIVNAGSDPIKPRIKQIFEDARAKRQVVRQQESDRYHRELGDLRQRYFCSRDHVDVFGGDYKGYKKEADALFRDYCYRQDFRRRQASGAAETALEDIYDAMCRGDHFRGYSPQYGHGSQYYSDRNNVVNETIANWGALSVANPGLCSVLREEYPDLCDQLDAQIDSMLEAMNNGK